MRSSWRAWLKGAADHGESAKQFLAHAESNFGEDGDGFIYDLNQREMLDFLCVIGARGGLEGSARSPGRRWKTMLEGMMTATSTVLGRDLP